MSRVTSELAALSRKWGNQSAVAAIVQLAALAFVAGGALMLATAYWAGLAALIAGLILAKRKWPRVRIRSYFRSKKAVLPAVLIAGGVGLQYVVAGVMPAASAVGGSTVAMLAGGLGATCALSLTMAIFEGKAMKNVFELVPVDQQPELQQFLTGADPAAGAAGQRADLSDLDPTAVAEAIKGKVVGQDAIVSEVVRTVFRRADLRRPAKPLATFLFVGPTGCGKSELAKALATTIFNGRIVNLPLNQMKKAEDLWGLIGSPPGYTGSERGGKLCRDLARLGTGVLVLDEIEKAHPDIIQALMRLLDEGQITEQSTGTVYSARGFVIVGTSNAAASEIGEIARVEADIDTRAAKVRGALTDCGFPPEIIARFDDIYPFPPLGRAAVAQIVCLMAERHARAAGVEVASIDGALLIDLIRKQEKGADAGMRNLDRQVERLVLDGFLTARKGGAKRVSVRVIDGHVDVRPVAADGGVRA